MKCSEFDVVFENLEKHVFFEVYSDSELTLVIIYWIIAGLNDLMFMMLSFEEEKQGKYIDMVIRESMTIYILVVSTIP